MVVTEPSSWGVEMLHEGEALQAVARSTAPVCPCAGQAGCTRCTHGSGVRGVAQGQGGGGQEGRRVSGKWPVPATGGEGCKWWGHKWGHKSLQQEGRAASGGATSGVTSPCNRRCVLPSGGATAAWLHHMVPGWQLPIEFAHWSWCLCDGFNVLTGPGAFLMVLMCLVVMVPL